MNCMGLNAGGGGVGSVAPFLSAFLTFFAGEAREREREAEEGLRRRERGAEGEALHFRGEQDCKLDNRPTFLRLQGNLCCCLPAQHRQLSAIVPVFQCVT